MNLYLISVVVICSLDLVSSTNSRLRTLHPKNINSLLLQTTSRFIDGIEESASETEQAAELTSTDKKVDQKEVNQESVKKDDQAKQETQEAAPAAPTPEQPAQATPSSQKLSQDKSEEQKAEQPEKAAKTLADTKSPVKKQADSTQQETQKTEQV